MNRNKDDTRGDMNRDPISGAPGAHPVGVGVGAAGGAVAGAAVGAVGGPVGSAAGAVIGGIAGGLAGKAAGEAVNPTTEEAYWRDNFEKEPYYSADYNYDDYAPAYRTGYQGVEKYQGRRFEDVDADLQRDYEAGKGPSRLSWQDAKQATRSAWQRVEPGDSGNSGGGR